MESVFLSINFKTIDPLIRENLFFFIEKSLLCFVVRCVFLFAIKSKSSFGWRHQVNREFRGQIVSVNFDADQMHCQGEFVSI